MTSASRYQPPRFPQGHRRRASPLRSPSPPTRARSSARRPRPTRRFAPNVWVTIATDGTITIVSPAAEMGQGSFTTLPADHRRGARRRLVEGQADPAARTGTTRATAIRPTAARSRPRRARPCTAISSRCGSRARRRGACCSTRSRRNGTCRSAELSTEPSVVVHKASSRRISYGEIAAFAKAPAELPKIEEKDLKPPASFRLIGKDVPRVELPLKVTGAAKYAHGRAGPRHGLRRGAAIALSGGAPQTVDDAAARKVPGITDVVRLPDGVGVIGDDASRARRPPRTCSRSPGRDAPGAQHDSERALEEFAAVGRDMSREGVPYEKDGRRQGRHEERRQGVPRRIPHALRLSRPDGADERDRLGQRRRQVGRDLGRHAGRERPAQRRPRSCCRPTAAKHHAAPACSRRRLRPPRAAGGDRSMRCGSPRRSASR